MKGDKAAAATRCFIAAAVYVVFLLMSMGCLYKAKQNRIAEENEKAMKASSVEIKKDKNNEKKVTKSATKVKKTSSSKSSARKKTKRVSKK